jgi:hypothetical protein
MAVAGTVFDDAADVGEESHIEHAIGFVEDEELDLIEFAGAAAEVIEEAAWCGDEDIDAGLEGFELSAVADAAVDDSDLEFGEAREVTAGGFDLGGEFAGGFEDKGARVVGGIGELSEDGEGEGGGFAGASLGAADDVVAIEDEGYGAKLDGCGFDVSHSADAIEDGFGQAQACERHRGWRLGGLAGKGEGELDALWAAAVSG